MILIIGINIFAIPSTSAVFPAPFSPINTVTCGWKSISSFSNKRKFSKVTEFSFKSNLILFYIL